MAVLENLPRTIAAADNPRPGAQPPPEPPVATPSYLDSIRWVSVYNESGEDVPGGALLRPTGSDSDGVLTIDKPNADNLPGLLIAHPSGIPEASYGLATADDFGPVKYDSTLTPAVGDWYGSKKDQWYATEKRTGWIIDGEQNGQGLVEVQRVTQVDGWTTFGLGGFLADNQALNGTTWEHSTDGKTAWLTLDVGILYEPGYYLLCQPFAGRLQFGGPANIPSTNGNAWAASLEVAWGRIGQLSGLSVVCSAGTFGVPSLSLTNFRRVNFPGMGTGCLPGALRLTTDNIPYKLRATFIARLIEVGGGGTGGFRFGDQCTANYRLGSLVMTRVPRIRSMTLGGCASGSWDTLAVSQPSPLLCNNVAEAVDDTFTTLAGGVLVIGAPGVLDNDTFPGGYSAVLDTEPQYGTLIFNPNGSFTYKQDGDLSGLRPPVADTFSYHLSDGSNDSNSATVTILIEDDGSIGPTRSAVSSSGSSASSFPSQTGPETEPGIG